MENIFVAGHNGLIGSSLFRKLKMINGSNVLSATREKLDLLNQKSVFNFFENQQIDTLYIAAASGKNFYIRQSSPADIFYQNNLILLNLVQASYIFGVKRVMLISSSHIYNNDFDYPDESNFLNGPIELDDVSYVLSKISSIVLANAYNQQHGLDIRCIVPVNVYGPNDNYSINSSPVVASLIRNIHFAKMNFLPNVKILGSGQSVREFIYVDDVADAAIFIMSLKKNEFQSEKQKFSHFYNVGSGQEINILELAKLISKVIGYSGEITTDQTMNEGVKRRAINSDRLLKLGWKPNYSLIEGIEETYEDFTKRFLI